MSWKYYRKKFLRLNFHKKLKSFAQALRRAAAPKTRNRSASLARNKQKKFIHAED